MEPYERIVKENNTGAAYAMEVCGVGDLSCLVDMYRVFSPRPASQGLPPEDPQTCECWVQDLLRIGINVLAKKEDRVIGHAALIPDPKGTSGEFVIFVHQDYRNLGIGTELTRLILLKARELGYASVWLTVAIKNFIAIKLYRKLGFAYCDMDDCERTMRIELAEPDLSGSR
ncbi:MAG: GNAT family N-acetyltransferase [Deltaproteobacteria bacterium]|nr:GNAT family N-acetyltransferase [Deltaproteobacteria bacterium]